MRLPFGLSYKLGVSGEAPPFRAKQFKSFGQAFSKACADPTRGALVAARKRRILSFGIFFLLSFFFWASCIKRKSEQTIKIAFA